MVQLKDIGRIDSWGFVRWCFSRWGSSKGSALFLILIAVALFAALSYAVTRSGRGGGTIQKEQAELDASQLIQRVGAMAAGLQRMVLINGCTETQFNFAPRHVNPTAPADKSCDVFDANGGRMNYQDYGSFLITGSVSVLGVGTAAPDLIYLDHEVGVDACRAINQHLHGAQPTGASEGIASSSDFTGTYPAVTGTIGDDASGFYSGKVGGCFSDGNPTDPYKHFFYVIYER